MRVNINHDDEIDLSRFARKEKGHDSRDGRKNLIEIAPFLLGKRRSDKIAGNSMLADKKSEDVVGMLTSFFMVGLGIVRLVSHFMFLEINSKIAGADAVSYICRRSSPYREIAHRDRLGIPAKGIVHKFKR
jgi:hypothetical protein